MAINNLINTRTDSDELNITALSQRRLIDYDPTFWPNTSLYWNMGNSRSKLEPPGGGTAPPLASSPIGANFNYMEFTRSSSNGFTETATDIADYWDPKSVSTREVGAVMFVVVQVDGSVIGSGKMAFAGWNGPTNTNAALLVYDRTSQKLELFNNSASPNPGSTNTITDNQLYCFALRKDNLDLNVFIDGVQDSALDITYTVGEYPTSDSFNLGFEYDTGPTPGDYLEGRIYRCLVYDVPMSDQWIADISSYLLDYYRNPYTI